MLRVSTAGESHGRGLAVVVEGLPAGLQIDRKYIDHQLKRRQKGFGRGGRMEIEEDKVVLVSGIRHGVTIGSPVCLFIENRDHEAWLETMNPEPVEGEIERIVKSPRPGHADLAGGMKYGHKDLRNVLEKASARETAARVAAGAICRKLLEEFNIKIYSQVIEIGGVKSSTFNSRLTAEMFEKAESSPVRCPDQEASLKMVEVIEEARQKGETVGGAFMVAADNVVPGIGSYVQPEKRLDARLASALMSIPAVKAVEVGDGIAGAGLLGSAVHDEIFYDPEEGIVRKTNRAGGMEGGVSNGEQLWARCYVKPIPTLRKGLFSIDIENWVPSRAAYERSDVCAVPAAAVVAEAMLAQVLVNEYVTKFGGDSLAQMKANFENYTTYLEKVWRWKRTLS